jgi:ABC-type uncharacterized transport system auxiliary subunit
LSACGGSLFESKLPVPTRYVIAPPAPAAAAVSSAASQVSLSIGRPDVAPGLDTDQIAAIRGHELDYYRGALWSGRVVETVQSFLVAAFGDQKRFHSVAAEQARIAGEYLFDVEVRDFQAEYSGGAVAPTVRVTLIGRLIRVRDRKLVDTISAAGTQQATENRLSSVATAFETVMQKLSLDLVQRTADAVASDRTEHPPVDTRT